MPLAVMDPVTAQSLAAIGLPNGPNTTTPKALTQPPPDAATNAMTLGAQLGANPVTNGSQTTQPVNTQPASQQDTQAIYSDSAAAQPQQAPPSSQVSRMQAAQAAMQPTSGQQQQMAVDPNNEDPGANIGATQPPMRNDQTLGQAATQAWDALNAPGQLGSPGTAARLQAAQAASPPAAAPGGPQGAPATTPPATTQTPSTGAPGPVTPPQGTTGTPMAAPAPAPTGGTSPVGASVVPAASSQPVQQSPKGPIGPADIANAIYGQESSYGSNTRTSPTGAVGGMQIEPGTWKQYAQPGEDINNPADNRAVGQRIVQDLYQKSGGDPARVAVGYFSGPDNIAPPGSPTPWIKDKSDGNTSVSQYVSGVLGKLGQPVPTGQGGWTQGGNLGPNSRPGAYSGIDAIQQGAAVGLNPQDMMGLATSLGYKPIDTQAFNNRSLIAMGLALMGGRTWADSAKNAAGVMDSSNNAMLGVQEHQNQNALSLAQVGLADKRMAMQMGMEGARIAAMDRERPMGPATMQADGTYGTTMYNPVTQGTRVVQTGTPATTGTQYLKDNMKQQAELQAEGEAGAKNMANFNTLQKLTQDPSTAAGPGIVNEAKRAIGMALPGSGIGANASGVQLAQMLTKEFQSDAAGTMRGLGLRNQREFDTFVGQAAKIDTDPAAAAAMAKPMLENSKQDYQAWQDWQAQDPATMSQRLHTLNGVNTFRQPYAMSAAQTNLAASQQSPTGLAKGARDTGAAAATAAQSASGYTAPNGISIKFSQ